ncbi:hypothetical protein JYU34_019968 [Plutella xylostella]|uniref:Retrotransposon gag domain-containing protein n=1 Tax=Plutella xylostella TaxID=51655 RepID=A0ABQ7PVN9_PLUXY|nr:hypothetical protein JYU34_019968 [Plutella xylostella]
MSQELDFGTLFKFVKPYDGNRETLNSFLVNCDNAINLASDQQKPILFKFILSQLNGKAEVACSIKDFNSWDQLKEFLKTQFSERKHYSHLLTDLQESRQGPQENVSVYALRIETHLSQLLTEISLNNSKVKELPGRIAAMEDLALHHFLMGLHPRISNIVRCKSPKTLNEAVNFAISEERIQLTLYRRPQSDGKTANSNSGYNYPKSKASTSFRPTAQGPPSTSNFNRFPRNFNSPPQQKANDTFCRYCKASDHDISMCKKREYNNNRFKSSQNATYKPRVNFIEQPDDEAGYDEVDASHHPEPLNE